MSDEKKSRIKVDDLDEQEKELTPEEAKEVKGGEMGDGSVRFSKPPTSTNIQDGTSNTILISEKIKGQ